MNDMLVKQANALTREAKAWRGLSIDVHGNSLIARRYRSMMAIFPDTKHQRAAIVAALEALTAIASDSSLQSLAECTRRAVYNEVASHRGNNGYQVVAMTARVGDAA